MQIIQIVPKLPPAIDGIGDYALNLACELREIYQIDTLFVVGDCHWQGSKVIEGFRVIQVEESTPEAIKCQLNYETVLLHYVGYGYANKGCPFWLIRGLQDWLLGNHNQGKLITMFHEIAALGRPPWTSAFWLSPLQMHLATRLTQMSDRLITSKDLYADTLTKISRGRHKNIPHLPVFSNVGELNKVLPLVERSQRIIVFGGRANRLRAYQESLPQLISACEQLGIKEIWDIGSPTGLNLADVHGIPVVEQGRLSKGEISQILSISIAGFFDYNPIVLGKSTIFAAYCAHGMLPVAAYGIDGVVDGIEAGKHYWLPDREGENKISSQQLQEIAENAYCWYGNHNLATQSKVFAELVIR